MEKWGCERKCVLEDEVRGNLKRGGQGRVERRSMEKKDKIGEALLKVALGYQVAEVTEEYAEVDGTLKLTKRKKTKKDVPPDLKAVQMLLSGESDGGFLQWTDEELELEKAKLLSALKEAEEKTVVQKTTAKKTTVKKSATGKSVTSKNRRK